MLRKGRIARLARLGGKATGLVGDAAAATAHLVTGGPSSTASDGPMLVALDT